MANLREIKKRIRSVKKTQKLTSAMKMVAAARLRRIEPRLHGTRKYHDSIEETLARVFLEYPLSPGRFPLVQGRGGTGTTGLILISGERGLCGAYNSNAISAGVRFMSQRPEIRVVALGKKGVTYMEKHGVEMLHAESEVLDNMLYSETRATVRAVMDSYLAGEVSEWYLIYHRFVSMMSQELRVEKLLPMELPKTKARTALDFVAEPEIESMVEQLLPQRLYAKCYLAILESVASEQGARRNAMENASDNAVDMIEKLTLLYNRRRQAAITTEILEVVSGAES